MVWYVGGGEGGGGGKEVGVQGLGGGYSARDRIRFGAGTDAHWLGAE